jgi:hypothetical protein
MARRNPEELEPEEVAEGDINLLGEPEDEGDLPPDDEGEPTLEGDPALEDDDVGETLIEVMEDVLDELKGLRSDIRSAIG